MATIVVLLLFAATVVEAAAGRGRNKRVFITPTPGTVVVDGTLTDWDRSGEIWIYVNQETAEMGSAKYAMMYDADALYIGAEVRDPTPLLNRNDPRVEPHLAWRGDVCQIFLSLDPALGFPLQFNEFTKDEKILHGAPVSTLYLWYYTDRQEPALGMFRGMRFTKPVNPALGANGAVGAEHFQAAYRQAEDGKGYTFEYRIPWKTLGMATTPKAGDLLAGVVCLFWGDATGLGLANAGTAYDVMSKPGFPWQNTDCWGKLIFAEKGNLPRELVEEGLPPEKPLPVTFGFDMPRDGQASLVLLDEAGRPLRHVVTQTDLKKGPVTVRWDGLGAGNQPLPAGTYQWKGIHHDPITTKFKLSVHNSGQPPYKTEDGTGGWGGDHSSPTSVTAAGDDMLLFWPGGESGWGLIRTDLKGKKKWGIHHGGHAVVTDRTRIYLHTGHEIIVREFADGRTINFGNGQPRLAPPDGGDKTNNAPAGLALQAGQLYVAYPGRNLIGVYDAAEGALQSTIPVEQPRALALATNGTLFVISGATVRSADGKIQITDHLAAPAALTVDSAGNLYVANRGQLQNVSVFDATGKYVRSIGQPGGRPRRGLYDPAGMLEPGGITVDKQSRLWVAETLDSPRRHSVWNTTTGELLTEFFGGSEYSTGVAMDPLHPAEVYCHDVIWQVDLATGKWYPKTTYWRKADPNEPAQSSYAGTGPAVRVFTAKNGRQYLWGQWPSMVFRRDGDLYKPFLTTFIFRNGVLFPVLTEFAATQRNDQTFIWQDLNGDSQVQLEEVTKSPLNGIHWVDADLNLYAAQGVVVRPIRHEPDGRPVYDFSKSEKLPIPGNAQKFWVDPHDGSYYTALATGTGIARWTPQGELLWNHRPVTGWHGSLNLPPAKPGEVWGVTDPVGFAGEITGVMTYFGPVSLFTRDGIFVAQIMNNKGFGPDRLLCESFYGNLVRTADARTYLLAGDQDGRITEVLGLDSIARFSGTHTITAAAAQTAAAAKTEYDNRKTQSQPLIIARGPAQLKLVAPVSRVVDAERGFRIRAAYDATNLFVAYEVDSPASLTNSHPDLPTLFRGGNCLDLQLATDPAADPKRKKPAPGDVRLLVTRRDNKPLAALYRPQVAGFKGEPITLTSPVGTETFAAIEDVSAQIKLDYKPRPGGFTATITVPLTLLGWTPQPGTLVKCDVGYIFGGARGNLAERRVYWSNNSFTAGVVNDIPHESRLEPAEWGMATVE